MRGFATGFAPGFATGFAIGFARVCYWAFCNEVGQPPAGGLQIRTAWTIASGPSSKRNFESRSAAGLMTARRPAFN